MATTEGELEEKARALVKEIGVESTLARRGPVHVLLIVVG